MNARTKILALMVALAAGSAAAASAGTTAGTGITNTATATFTDPTTGTGTSSVTSNTVTTTVLPVTGFDIVYQGGFSDGTKADSSGTPAIPTAYDVKNVVPGGQVVTTYTVVNNSNIDNYKIDTVADTTGTANPPASVKYYPANTTIFIPANELPKEADGVTPYVSVGVGNQKDIIQVITLPAAATAGQTYSASPHGTAPTGTVGGNTYTAYDENANDTTNTPPNDLEFTRATVATPLLVPVTPTDVVPGTPGNQPPATPGTGTPPATGPTGPANVPTTVPTYTTPGNTGNPGNTGSPTNPGTVIAVNTNGNQDAYPKSDADTLPDVVTFISEVKNNGQIADTVQVKPTLPAGATSLKVLDAAGNALTPDANGKYTLPGPVAVGASVAFQVVVTYPDSDGVNPQNDIVVPVGVFSQVVPSTAPLGTVTLTIHPPQLVFGDTVSGANPNPALTPLETVVPGAATNTTTGTTNDASAVFPVSVKNSGTYSEAYTLVGSVPIKLTDGTTVTVPVTYYNAGGSALATPGETLVIAAGATGDYLAVVNVPANAAATTGTAGLNPQPSLTQIATGKYSGDKATDTNDQIKIGVIGGITVAKTQSINGGAFANTPANAKPGDAISYQIIATNTYNSPVFNFKLIDNGSTAITAPAVAANNTFTFTNFVSASVALSAQFNALTSKTVFYSVNGGTTFINLTTTPPTPATVTAANGIQVAVDTDGSGTITAADQVPAGATITLIINTTVK